jgi:hypothetical protein
MFTPRGEIYTVHEKADIADPVERVELVREGFSVWAFVFGGFWLLFNRLWVPLVGYALVAVALGIAAMELGVDEIGQNVLQFGLQLMLAFHAHDLQRWALARRGYAQTGVVLAPSEILAEQRVHDRAAA